MLAFNMRTPLLLILLFASAVAHAETVDVQYQGPVNVDSFDCADITRSSFINRFCCHEGERYLIVQLRSRYYHYCAIGGNVVAAFMAAPSMGRFYNANIKSSSNDGLYDCRNHEVPRF